MKNLERVGAAVMIGDRIVAIRMRGAWYSIVKGDYEVVIDTDKIAIYNKAPKRRGSEEAERATVRMRVLDALQVIRDINGTRT